VVLFTQHSVLATQHYSQRRDKMNARQIALVVIVAVGLLVAVAAVIARSR
jgi:hypothetical protein